MSWFFFSSSQSLMVEQSVSMWLLLLLCVSLHYELPLISATKAVSCINLIICYYCDSEHIFLNHQPIRVNNKRNYPKSWRTPIYTYTYTYLEPMAVSHQTFFCPDQSHGTEYSSISALSSPSCDSFFSVMQNYTLEPVMISRFKILLLIILPTSFTSGLRFFGLKLLGGRKTNSQDFSTIIIEKCHASDDHEIWIELL